MTGAGGDLWTLEEFRQEVDGRVRLADADPEQGHHVMDALADDVIGTYMRDAEEPDAYAKALLYQELLQREKDEGWRRWYA